jgi:hypothetical protein
VYEGALGLPMAVPESGINAPTIGTLLTLAFCFKFFVFFYKNAKNNLHK